MGDSAPTFAKKGAIACELSEVSAIGAQILEAGGSAADAIIAVILCVGVIASYHVGIGGGGFALIRKPEGGYESLDFRVAAPAAAHPGMYDGIKKPQAVGGISVAVPGELRGLEWLHKKYGKLPWKDCFKPAIRFARKGYKINDDLYEAMSNTIPGTHHHAADNPTHPTLSWLLTSPTLSTVYRDPSSLPDSPRFLPVDSITHNPKLANTLEIIAESGADAFYSGPIAESMVKAVQADGGILTMEDLAGYKVGDMEPLSVDYRGGYKIFSTPAPSSGGVVLSALGTLGKFEDVKPVDDPVALHRALEAMKFAFGQRTLIGDPEVVEGVLDMQKGYLEPEECQKRAKVISDEKVLDPSEYNPQSFDIKEDNGTSHFCAADSSGLVITLTSTVLLFWGSRIMVPETGILLNNGMEDFSAESVGSNTWGYAPTPSNFIAPGKRPLSSQSPYIIEGPDGGFVFAGGCAGGSKIISANIQCARNVLDYDMGPIKALLQARTHNQLTPLSTLLELPRPSHHIIGFTREQALALQAMGHKTQEVMAAQSTSCAIGWTKQRGWESTGDPRKLASGGSVI